MKDCDTKEEQTWQRTGKLTLDDLRLPLAPDGQPTIFANPQTAEMIRRQLLFCGVDRKRKTQ